MLKHDPEDFHEELEELFSNLWRMPGFAGPPRGFRPQVDCYRSDEPPSVTLIVDLAGVEPDRVEIDVSERTVVVRGDRSRPGPSCRVSYRQMEIEHGPFQRRITLAEDVDPAQAKATYERGLLTVVMPLAHNPRSGRVSIEIGRRA